MRSEYKNDPMFIRGYLDAKFEMKRADGIDWAKAKMALIEAQEATRTMLANKDAEIMRLRMELRAQKENYEAQITDLESHIEALKIAWKHRREEE